MNNQELYNNGICADTGTPWELYNVSKTEVILKAVNPEFDQAYSDLWDKREVWKDISKTSPFHYWHLEIKDV